MNYLAALGLAVIQGLTEFLPVSSSGHLVLAREIFGWSDDGGLLFDTVLHAGSLAAILLYFWRDWLAMLRGWLRPRDPELAGARRRLWLLLAATAPVAVAGPLLKPLLESATALRNAQVAGLSMLATALFFWLCERRAAAGTPRPLGWRQALAIGCCQVVALLPGASRSGWTAGGGLLCGQPRADAVRFAFCLALPAIGGATLLQARELLAAPAAALPPAQLALGFLAAFAASLGAIHFCVRFLRAHSLHWFAVYLAAAGALALILAQGGI